MLPPSLSKEIENGLCRECADEPAGITPGELQDWSAFIADGDLPLVIAELESHPDLLPAIRARRRSRILRFLGRAIAEDILVTSRRQ